MEIPRDKPREMLDAEWVARHRTVTDPVVTSPMFLAELKSIMIELAGWRLTHEPARVRLKLFLESCGYTPGIGFPDESPGTWSPVIPGFENDLLCFDRLDWTITHQTAVLYGARDRYSGHDTVRVEQFPAWMLIKIHGAANDDWRERWRRIGGNTFQPLVTGRSAEYEETGLIALKCDPIWRNLGDPAIFADALGIDHPPFYLNSGLSWREVEGIEATLLGLIESSVSPEGLERLRQRHIARKVRGAQRLDESIQRRNEEYAKSEQS
jgi:hypothetical protein